MTATVPPSVFIGGLRSGRRARDPPDLAWACGHLREGPRSPGPSAYRRRPRHASLAAAVAARAAHRNHDGLAHRGRDECADDA